MLLEMEMEKCDATTGPDTDLTLLKLYVLMDVSTQ